MPDGMLVEVRDIVTPGVWTDLTQYVDWSAQASTRYGRTSPYSAAQAASLSLTFDNTDGRFTPKRQILVDGTAHPYYPNLIPKRGIRLAWVIAGTPYYRYQGRIKGWPPAMRDTYTPRVTINAVDDMDRLSRVKMAGDIQGEILADYPIAYWPLSEQAGSAVAVDASGVNAQALYDVGTGPLMSFGNPGPGTSTAATFAAGLFLKTISAPNLNLAAAFTVSMWVKYTTVTDPLESIFSLQDSTGNTRDMTTGSAGPGNGVQWVEVNSGVSGALQTSPGPLNDGLWHHLALTNASPGASPILYVDGVAAAPGPTSTPMTNIVMVVIGAGAWARFTGSVAHVAIYNTALSAARIAAQYGVGAQTGELVSDKVARFLGYAGLTSATWNIDPSTVLTGTYNQATDVASACQDMVTTEGGGSVFYVTPDGKARFMNRAARKPGAPTLTVDVGADVDGNTYQPAYDDSSIANRVTGSRATASGVASTQRAFDAAAITRDGVSDDSFTSYAASDLDVLDNAQARLSQQKTPAFRLAQVVLDLTTATTPGLYAAVASTLIGSRIRATSLYAAAAPATQLDGIVEGWADTYSQDGISVAFDLSPADRPAGFVLDDPVYGRLQPLPDCALNAAITNAATTVVIKSPTGPRFTTVAARYTPTPLDIQVDEEIIGLNSAPGGGTTPQTFTGVTRGKYGTTAVAHASGAQVTLWPFVGLAL